MPENASLSTRASMLEAALALTLVAGAATAASSYYWMSRKPHGHAGNDDDKDESSPSSHEPLSILEFEQEAKLRASPLAKLYVNYYDGQGLTGTVNRQFLQSIRLMPRILQGDLSEIDTELVLFDYEEDESDNGSLNPATPSTTLKLPVIIAPTSLHNLTCEDGEIATARACARSGAGYSYNWMLSSKPYLDVLEASASVTKSDPSADSPDNGMWLHLYMYEEREMVQESIRLAEATGAFSAIVLTCDHPHLRVQNRMVPIFAEKLPKETAESDTNHMHDHFFPNQAAAGGSKATVRQVTAGEGDVSSAGSNNPRLSWKSVKWIVSLTKLPVVVKGVLSPEDAVEAMRAGAAAIVVSNHGGRQFDGAPPAMEVLPAIVAKINSRIPVLVDSGIRTSTDIIKALCLGASGVMLGRPALWALSCGGEDSLCRMLDHLQSDIADDMRSLGAGSIEDLDMSFVYAPDRLRIEKDIDVAMKDFDSDSD
jgi:isopentenyl diphosphate isomerase/L-lactate dehydrogenase-like FMN-dependent dehydrogenase